MPAAKPSDHAFSFEAVLLGATKDAKGYIVKLVIHPNDVPDELVKDYVGTRYQIAAVKLNDDGSPAGKPKRKDGGEVQHAALLCKNPLFWNFMERHYSAINATERSATEAMRDLLGIESRRELATDERARRRFHELVAQYEKYVE